MEALSSRVMIAHRDFEGAVRWWTETLGLRIYREYGNHGRRLGVVLFAGNGLIELAGGGVPTRALGEGYLLWLQVPDAAATVERLRTAGTTIDEDAVVKPWGLVEARVRDPEGVGIVLVQVPADHPIRARLD